MTDQVVVDTQSFRDAAALLTTIKDEFDNSEENTVAAAEDIPHELLAETVRRFALNWDTKRGEFSDSIDILNQMGNAIAEHFEQYDTDTAAAAEESGEG